MESEILKKCSRCYKRFWPEIRNRFQHFGKIEKDIEDKFQDHATFLFCISEKISQTESHVLSFKKIHVGMIYQYLQMICKVSDGISGANKMIFFGQELLQQIENIMLGQLVDGAIDKLRN